VPTSEWSANRKFRQFKDPKATADPSSLRSVGMTARWAGAAILVCFEVVGGWSPTRKVPLGRQLARTLERVLRTVVTEVVRAGHERVGLFRLNAHAFLQRCGEGMRATRATKPNGHLLGSYRIATAPRGELLCCASLDTAAYRRHPAEQGFATWISASRMKVVFGRMVWLAQLQFALST